MWPYSPAQAKCGDEYSIKLIETCVFLNHTVVVILTWCYDELKEYLFASNSLNTLFYDNQAVSTICLFLFMFGFYIRHSYSHTSKKASCLILQILRNLGSNYNEIQGEKFSHYISEGSWKDLDLRIIIILIMYSFFDWYVFFSWHALWRN